MSKDRLGRTGQSAFLPKRPEAPPSEEAPPAPKRPRGRPKGPEKVPVTVQFELDPLEYLDDARKAYRRRTRSTLDRSALLMRLLERMQEELEPDQLAEWIAEKLEESPGAD